MALLAVLVVGILFAAGSCSPPDFYGSSYSYGYSTPYAYSHSQYISHPTHSYYGFDSDYGYPYGYNYYGGNSYGHAKILYYDYPYSYY